MLEKVTFNKKPMKKAVYKEQWDELLAKLVVLQQQAHNEGVGLVVLFEGWNGAGKGSRISDLMYNLDARATSVYVTEDLDVEAARAFAGACSLSHAPRHRRMQLVSGCPIHCFLPSGARHTLRKAAFDVSLDRWSYQKQQ